MIIDAHLQIWTREPMRYPWQPITRLIPEFDAPVELLLDLMGQAGVDRAVLIQPSAYGYDHTYLAEALRRYPGRFSAVGLVDPLASDAPSQLTRLVEEVGVRGLRLTPSSDPRGIGLDDPRTFPLWRKAEELGVAISVLGQPRQMVHLEAVARIFPQVKVIVDHLGRALADEFPDFPSFEPTLRLARLPNTYLKLSGIPAASSEDFPYRDVMPIVRLALERFGPRRLLWGTDFPWILQQCGYAPALKLVQQEWRFLSAEDREWVLCKTARGLFWPDEE